MVQRDISIGAFFWLVRGPRQQRAHSSGASAPRPHVQCRSVVSAWREYVRTGSPKLRDAAALPHKPAWWSFQLGVSAPSAVRPPPVVFQ